MGKMKGEAGGKREECWSGGVMTRQSFAGRSAVGGHRPPLQGAGGRRRQGRKRQILNHRDRENTKNDRISPPRCGNRGRRRHRGHREHREGERINAQLSTLNAQRSTSNGGGRETGDLRSGWSARSGPALCSKGLGAHNKASSHFRRCSVGCPSRSAPLVGPRPAPTSDVGVNRAATDSSAPCSYQTAHATPALRHLYCVIFVVLLRSCRTRERSSKNIIGVNCAVGYNGEKDGTEYKIGKIEIRKPKTEDGNGFSPQRTQRTQRTERRQGRRNRERKIEKTGKL